MDQTTKHLLLAILCAIMITSIIVIIIVAKRMKRLEKSLKQQDEFYEEGSCLKEKYEIISNRALTTYVVCGVIFLSGFSWAATIIFF